MHEYSHISLLLGKVDKAWFFYFYANRNPLEKPMDWSAK